VCEALGADHDLLNAAVGPGLLEVERDALTAVQMDPSVVYMDVTSYASGEPDLLPVAMTGQSGRRITQINDVHDNLDLLYALRLLVNRTDDVGMLLRAALIVEVYSLIELAIGPPRGEKPARDGASLVDFVDRQRGEEGYAQLEEIRTRVVPEETHSNLLALRERVAAHLDDQMAYAEVVETTLSVSVDDLFLAADQVLDALDAAARAHVDLGYLVLGHPEIKSFAPIDQRTTPATFMADHHARFLDEPFGCFVGAGFGPKGSAAAVAAVSRRSSTRRTRWIQVS